MLSQHVPTQVTHLHRDRHHPAHWHFSTVCPRLLLHHLQHHSTGTAVIPHSPHYCFPYLLHAHDLLQPIRHLWYFCTYSGLIRRKNKFVIVYAVTMVIYMGTFLALAIITLQTPQFITSQCDQPDPSPGSNNFEATSVAAKNLLCKN